MSALELASCPVCRTGAGEIVCEFSNLILLDEHHVNEDAKYAYRLCDGCGLVYASRRPNAEMLRRLYEQFDDNLGRVRGSNRTVPRPRPPSSDVDVPDMSAAPIKPSPLLPALERIGSWHGARILEVRAKNAHLLAALRERYQAEVFGLCAFDKHHLKLMGRRIPVAHLDFSEPAIPFDGPFDLVVSNHMLTHALFVDRYMAALQAAIRDGGWLYLYNENSDRRLFERGKNLIGEMKCFHFQNFDEEVCVGLLNRYGFDVTDVTVERGGASSTLAITARRDSTVVAGALPREHAAARLAMYTQWETESLLMLPDRTRSLIAPRVAAAGATALHAAYGRAKEDGTVVPVRRMELCHEDGYEAIRERRRTV